VAHGPGGTTATRTRRREPTADAVTVDVGFVPEYVVARVEALPPEKCPYCDGWPIPCALHRPTEEEEE
jgi:hypothetical protein